MAVAVGVVVSGVGALVTMLVTFGLAAFSLDAVPFWLFLFVPTLAVHLLLLAGAPKLEATGRKRNVWASVLAGSGVFAALTFGVMAALANLGGVWEAYADSGMRLLMFFFVLWWLWSIPLVLIALSRPEGFGRQLYRYLVGGTVLELLITIPIDVYVRRRTQCYCAEGTFFALSIGMSAAAALTGPALVFLMVARRQLLADRRAGVICGQCGYDLRHLTSDRCPECGRPIPKRKG
jgi:hypothetical protein